MAPRFSVVAQDKGKITQRSLSELVVYRFLLLHCIGERNNRAERNRTPNRGRFGAVENQRNGSRQSAQIRVGALPVPSIYMYT